MNRMEAWLKRIIAGGAVKYLPLVFLLLDACIEPFNLHVKAQENVVVDGLLSDQPGPHTVKIFRTFDLNLPYNQIQWVSGASVSIFDDQNNEIKLIERSTGNYQTDSAFQGVIGKTYRLHFATTDGDSYESVPQKMLAVGDIDSVYYDFQINEPPTTYEHGNSKNGFAVKVDAQVLPEQDGKVRWRWTGVFGLKTFPELQLRPTDGRGLGFVPDPPSCSGYDKRLQYQGPCTCCECYVTQFGDAVSVSDEQFINNGRIVGQNVVFVQANRRFMSEKYYVDIEQMSITPEVYAFWQKVSAQQTNSSNLFQTPPPPTTGNINLVSGRIPVSGVFSVSAIKSKRIVLTKLDVPYPMLPIDTIASSCRVAYPFSTTKKPSFW